MSDPAESLRQRRPRCARCGRPASHCLCSLIPHLESNTQLLVIQHPDEQRHALNTARLLVEGLTHADLVIAERLPTEWHQVLLDPARRIELLFPGKGVPEVLASSGDLRPRLLVLLDGTWRKARKLLYLNPVLQSLPQVALPAGLESRYRLRKAPGPDALSTLEAAMYALQIIEPTVDFSPLMRPFDALIDGQIQAMGADVYQQNYTKPRRD